MYNFIKMGNNSSKKPELMDEEKIKEAEKIKEDEEKIKEKALNKFNARIYSYNYAQHGSHYEYIQWCRAQYELECITEFKRKGFSFKFK